MITFHYIESGHYVHAVVTSPVGLNDFRQAFRDISQLEGWNLQCKELWNMLALSKDDLNFDFVELINLARVEQATKSVDSGTKTAVLATDSFIKEIVKEYEIISIETGLMSKIFDDEQLALEWLLSDG